MARSSGGERGRTDVAALVETIVGCKWSVRLLGLIARGTERPSALLRACPGLSAKVMNERLRKMLRFRILEREVCGEKPPLEVHYRLTPFGRRFARVLEEVERLQRAVDAGEVEAPPVNRDLDSPLKASSPRDPGPR